MDVCPACRFAEAVDLFYHASCISYRVGVGHGMNCRKSALSRSTGTGLHGFGIIIAGFAQVGVQIDQSGKHDLAGRVDVVFGVFGQLSTKAGYSAIGIDSNIGLFAVRGGPTRYQICDRHGVVAFHCPSCPASRRYSTAIRTETPLATCSNAVFWSESAAAAEISSPRFIGPGCIMSVGSPAMRWYRSLVNPHPRVYSAAEGKKSPDMRSA